MVKNIPTIERSTKTWFGKHATDDQGENTIVFNNPIGFSNTWNRANIWDWTFKYIIHFTRKYIIRIFSSLSFKIYVSSLINMTLQKPHKSRFQPQTVAFPTPNSRAYSRKP